MDTGFTFTNVRFSTLPCHITTVTSGHFKGVLVLLLGLRVFKVITLLRPLSELSINLYNMTLIYVYTNFKGTGK